MGWYCARLWRVTYLFILCFKPLAETTRPMVGHSWPRGAVVLQSSLKRRRIELSRRIHPHRSSQFRSPRKCVASPWKCYINQSHNHQIYFRQQVTFQCLTQPPWWSQACNNFSHSTEILKGDIGDVMSCRINECVPKKTSNCYSPLTV